MTRDDPRRQGHQRGGRAPTSRERVARARGARRRPGARHGARRRRRRQLALRRDEAQGVRRGRHREHRSGCCRRRATQAEIEAVVDELNADPACTGYIVQLPLPRGLDTNAVLGRVDPDKDADGLHPVNLGRLVLGQPAPLPCTPRGIVALLRAYDVPLDGAEVVVVGRGVTVGRPMGLLLTRRSENATVTLCHTGTPRPRGPPARGRRRHRRRRGRRPRHRRPGQAGRRRARRRGVAPRRRDGGGRRAPRRAARSPGFVAPNPGGVGPMTVAMLLTAVVEAARAHRG